MSGAATYRFLPWSRRGLVAQIKTPDPLTAALPARGAIRVALSLNRGAPIEGPMVSTYGPGDVLGVDTRVIVRLEPRDLTPDFEPSFLAAVDFDGPDFPWMLTPAAANETGGAHKLRPWLVLLVLDRDVVQTPRVEPGRQLPSITIPAAAAATELPDLAESWAWAHVQVAVPAGFAGNLSTEMTQHPDLNVSRLLCPRRLGPERRYFACLVPAFDQGVFRGLSKEFDQKLPLAPAWTGAALDVELPVYFHWEFSTGPAGDFEALARKLKPLATPAVLGYQRTYLHPEELDVAGLGPSQPEAHVWAEGALRAPPIQGGPVPGAGQPGAATSTIPQAIRDRLRERLDEPARIAAGQPATTTRVLGPPIYGGWAVNQHQIGGTPFVWLDELNRDPRWRLAAGLGAEVVRKNQEAFMQACWEQVGAILKANDLLNRARLAQEIGNRVFERFVKKLPGERLAELLAPMQARIPFATATVLTGIKGSSLPDHTFDPAMRRMVTPQRSWIKIALRLGNLTGPAATVSIVPVLNTATLAIDPTAFVPDGIAGSRAIDRARVPGVRDLDFRAVGLDTRLAAPEAQALVASVKAAGRTVRRRYQPLTLKPSLGTEGVILEAHTRGAFELADLAHAAGKPSVRIAEVLDGIRSAAAVAPRTTARLLVSREIGSRLTMTPLDAPRVVRDVRPPVPVPTITTPLPMTERSVVERYGAAYARYLGRTGVEVRPPAPKFVPAKLEQIRQALLVNAEPLRAIPARIRTMISLNGGSLTAAAGTGVMAPATLDRVMVGPKLPDAMYSYLAALDEARFLPGVEQLPQDSLVLMATNPRFVEAFMAGLNHEMNRELLWRGYPTDQRGTVFQKFWARSDGGDDITEIHTWPPQRHLGENAAATGAGTQIVILIRGQLLRRYPGTVALAWPGVQRDGRLQLKTNPAAGEVLAPVFSGRFAPDFTFFGFPLTPQDVQQQNWFFVLQQQPTEPRFGFDSPDAQTGVALASWLDATWTDIGTAEGAFIELSTTPLQGRAIGGVTFGRDAAHMAAVMLQRPFRAAFDARKLMARLLP